VIRLGRDYDGADLRWTTAGGPAGRRWSLIGGLAWDKLREHRQGFQDFTGDPTSPTLGVQGALRRDETNDVDDLDPYLQGQWHPADDWTLDAGVRHSRVRFASHDRYVVGANPDDSAVTASSWARRRIRSRWVSSTSRSSARAPATRS